jgi:hypothetical protein
MLDSLFLTAERTDSVVQKVFGTQPVTLCVLTSDLLRHDRHSNRSCGKTDILIGIQFAGSDSSWCSGWWNSFVISVFFVH